MFKYEQNIIVKLQSMTRAYRFSPREESSKSLVLFFTSGTVRTIALEVVPDKHSIETLERQNDKQWERDLHED